jgi:Reverse transcriptase (RNA-dependent DNA polymerase)
LLVILKLVIPITHYFQKKGENYITIILVYVDDIIIMRINLEKIKKVKIQLKKNFDIKDLGLLKYFLGIEIAHSSKGLFISQRNYALDLLRETEKLGCKPASTPIDSKYKVNTEEGEPLEDISLFQRLVGRLIYLMVTRLDISFSVSQISKFMHAPRTTHLNVIDKILRYLKGTPGKRIWMKNNNSNEICGYSDTNWAETFDRKLTTGFYIFVDENLATWKSKKQNVMARSSAEIKYRAMPSTVSELIWVKQLLKDIGIETRDPMKIFCDNQAARHIALNPVFHERTKHIEVDCHFIREKVQSKEIDTLYVKSGDQLADMFMKELDPEIFERNSCKLRMIDIYIPSPT